MYLTETMYSDLDPSPYFKGHGYTRHLNARVHNACVRAITYFMH